MKQMPSFQNRKMPHFYLGFQSFLKNQNVWQVWACLPTGQRSARLEQLFPAPVTPGMRSVLTPHSFHSVPRSTWPLQASSFNAIIKQGRGQAVVCCSWLTLLTVYFFTPASSDMLELEIYHSGGIYTTEIGKYYVSQLSFFSSRMLVYQHSTGCRKLTFNYLYPNEMLQGKLLLLIAQSDTRKS